jgi:hypothetical protein
MPLLSRCPVHCGYCKASDRWVLARTGFQPFPWPSRRIQHRSARIALRICELADSSIDVELSRPQISSILISTCSPDIRNAGPYSSVPSSWLGFPFLTSRTHQPCCSKRSLKSSKAASCFKVRWFRVPVRGSVVEEVLVGMGATF